MLRRLGTLAGCFSVVIPGCRGSWSRRREREAELREEHERQLREAAAITGLSTSALAEEDGSRQPGHRRSGSRGRPLYRPQGSRPSSSALEMSGSEADLSVSAIPSSEPVGMPQPGHGGADSALLDVPWAPSMHPAGISGRPPLAQGPPQQASQEEEEEEEGGFGSYPAMSRARRASQQDQAEALGTTWGWGQQAASGPSSRRPDTAPTSLAPLSQQQQQLPKMAPGDGRRSGGLKFGRLISGSLLDDDDDVDIDPEGFTSVRTQQQQQANRPVAKVPSAGGDLPEFGSLGFIKRKQPQGAAQQPAFNEEDFDF